MFFGLETLIDDILSTVEEARKLKYTDFMLRTDLKKLLKNYLKEAEEYIYEDVRDEFETSNENY